MDGRWMLACAAVLATAACEKPAQDGNAATPQAAAAAGDKTLATGLGDHGKLAAAIKAAGLEPALAGPTPYTLLAPADAAFDKLPAGTLDRLLAPEGRTELTALLSHHILPGTMLGADIAKAVEAGGGKAEIRTLGGGTVTVTRQGEQLMFADAAGTMARVTGAADERSNGVIHHIDAVLMPAKPAS